MGVKTLLFFESYSEFLNVFLIGIGLAMDAFAVSISNGISVTGFGKKECVKQGIYFGGFQFLMPLVGWFLGKSVKGYIEAFDHWVAFILLFIIGFNMLREAFSAKEEDCESCVKLTNKLLFFQALSTSIDALAIGISFAILNINILAAAGVIGIVTFIISFTGGVIGKKIGSVFEKKAEFIGGGILIIIGVKILIEHMFL